MSARNVTRRNPRVQLRRGDLVRSYGGGLDLVLAADGDDVIVTDMRGDGRIRRHATPCASSDLVARNVYTEVIGIRHGSFVVREYPAPLAWCVDYESDSVGLTVVGGLSRGDAEAVARSFAALPDAQVRFDGGAA